MLYNCNCCCCFTSLFYLCIIYPHCCPSYLIINYYFNWLSTTTHLFYELSFPTYSSLKHFTALTFLLCYFFFIIFSFYQNLAYCCSSSVLFSHSPIGLAWQSLTLYTIKARPFSQTYTTSFTLLPFSSFQTYTCIAYFQLSLRLP